MKLHLGCGKRYLKGYKHVDYSDYDHVDWVKPIYPLEFIKDSTVTEIYSSHALEYFDFQEALSVLNDWKRCLTEGGHLRLSVPDFDKLVGVYNLNNQNIDNIIGPLFGRWKIAENNNIYHHCVFNRKKLLNLLLESGFSNVTDWDPFTFFRDELADFDDYSKAVIPPMDFDNGFQISINFLATK